MALRSVCRQKGLPPPSPYTWILDFQHLRRGTRGWGGGHLPEDVSDDAFSERRPTQTSLLPSSCLRTCVCLASTDIDSKGNKINHPCLEVILPVSYTPAYKGWLKRPPSEWAPCLPSPTAGQILMTKVMLLLSPWYRVQKWDEIYFDWFIKNNLT